MLRRRRRRRETRRGYDRHARSLALLRLHWRMVRARHREASSPVAPGLRVRRVGQRNDDGRRGGACRTGDPILTYTLLTCCAALILLAWRLANRMLTAEKRVKWIEAREKLYPDSGRGPVPYAGCGCAPCVSLRGRQRLSDAPASIDICVCGHRKEQHSGGTGGCLLDDSCRDFRARFGQ